MSNKNISPPQKANSAEINALTSELAICRTQEQTSMNQITQFVVAAWTILMAVFAFGALTELDESFTTQLLLYWVTVAVLCVLGAYITSVGMTGIIRHHHMINLEDMISDTISNQCDHESNEMQRVLLWTSLSTAVNTLNYKNVKHNRTRIFFTSNIIEIIALIISGFLFIGIQANKLLIPPTSSEGVIIERSFLDYCGIFAPIAILIGIAIYGIKTYAYLTQHSKVYYEKAKSIGIEKWKKRTVGKLPIEEESAEKKRYQNTKNKASAMKTLYNILLYFLYPRIKDIQKMFFSILGFIFGWFLISNSDNISIYSFNFGELMLTLLITEVLIYQSRYQWNDLRGLREDLEEKKEAVRKSVGFPKLSEPKNYPYLILCSLIVLFIKLYFAFFILMPHYGEQQYLMFGLNIAILILALLYEFARSKNNGGWAVLILVGFGYPLRFMIGLFAAYPSLVKNLKLDVVLESMYNRATTIWSSVIEVLSIGGIPQQQEHLGVFICLVVFSLISFGVSFIAVGWVLSFYDILKNKKKSSEPVKFRPLRPHYIILAKIWLHSTGSYRIIDKSKLALEGSAFTKFLFEHINSHEEYPDYPLMSCDFGITWWNVSFITSILLLSVAQMYIDSSVWSFVVSSVPLVFSAICSDYPYTPIYIKNTDKKGNFLETKKNRRALFAYLFMGGYCIVAFIFVKISFHGNSTGLIYVFLSFLQFFYFVLYCSFRNSNYNELYNFLPNILDWIKLHIIYILIGKNTYNYLSR